MIIASKELDVLVFGDAHMGYLVQSTSLPRPGSTVQGRKFQEAPGGNGPTRQWRQPDSTHVVASSDELVETSEDAPSSNGFPMSTLTPAELSMTRRRRPASPSSW